MKKQTVILTSLLCLVGGAAYASDCMGTGCMTQQFDDAYYVSQYSPEPQNAMQQVKLLSIKPVAADNRAPVWDGAGKTFVPGNYARTVDSRDGAPIWDDSIPTSQENDFSDWFLEPIPELYIRDSNVSDVSAGNDIDVMQMYQQNMADAAATRARIEEILSPNHPSQNLWLDIGPQQTQSNVTIIDDTECESDESETVRVLAKTSTTIYPEQKTEITSFSECPFETETECEIWRRKPIIRENVSPRSPRIPTGDLNAFIDAARCNAEITANNPVAEPLLARYKMLMRSANACCTDGIVHTLKRAGASDGLIYKFMSDDANFSGFGARCLMMTDEELDTKYPNTATASVVADVRNGCLCRSREWFQSMLAPFMQVYHTMPEFVGQKFYYTYTDGLQREITTSVNKDVQNVLVQLSLCP